MATTDHTAYRFDPRTNLRGISGQAGRIITDEDLTMIGRIGSEEAAQDRIGIIGPHGTSDAGFRISGAVAGAGGIDFDIAGGTYWVGGLRAQLHRSVTYREQPDWLQNPGSSIPAGPRIDLVWLEVWEQIVAASEDAAHIDPAIGGVESTAKRRVMSRIHVAEDLTGEDCAALWADLQSRWTAANFGTVTPLNELAGDGQLTTQFTGAGQVQDLCSPPVAAGFLGAANRAIRVQMTSDSDFCWGFENGGRLMRAQITGPGALTLLTDPVDAFHWPAPGQVIQILPWGAVMDHGEKTADELFDCHFTTVETGYDPDMGTLTLVDDLPPGFGENWLNRPDVAALRTTKHGLIDPHDDYVFVRIWDRGEDRSAATLDASVPQALGTTGIEVTITGATLRRGDSWELSARPSAPDDILPWEMQVGMPYGSYRRYVVPLAQLRWENDVTVEVVDCRMRFRPLTRMGDCVSLRVGDGTTSHGDYDTIQAAVDALPQSGGKILVLPGTYPERVTLHGRQNIVIEGCAGRTHVVAPDTADEPVIDLRDVTNVTLRDMSIAAPDQLAVLATRSADNQAGNIGVHLDCLQITHFLAGGVMLLTTDDITITGCDIFATGTFSPGTTAPAVQHRPSIYVMGEEVVIRDCRVLGLAEADMTTALGGIHLAGGCEDVLLERCDIAGCYGHGITLGSVTYVTADTNPQIEAAYTAQGTTATQIYDFWLTDDNCFGIDPGRNPVDPEGGGELIPISDGPLERIVIRDCKISEMGGCGISVVRFFDFDAAPDFITTNDLEIRHCQISGNLLGENVAYPLAYRAVAAYGGITLGDATGVEVRDNRIEQNGLTVDSPATGVFVLFGEGVAICDNVIAANGRRVDQAETTPPGWRGGIIIGQVRPRPRVGPITDDRLRSDGGQALRITGNTVVAPQGRAVAAFGLGAMMVNDNRLTSQSGGLDGWLLALSAIVAQGRGMDLRVLLASALLVALRETNTPNALSGHAILTALGGEVVALGNSGFSSEIYLQMLGLSGALVQSEDAAFDYQGNLMAGGDIMLNDNQIRLDGLDETRGASISAVVAASLDSVMIQNNQIALDIDINDFVAINVLSLGWTVHMTSNRLKEPILNAFLSALTLGLMNTTAANQATHCVQAYGPAGLREDGGNTELIEALYGFEDSICDILRRELTSFDNFNATTGNFG